MKMNVALLTLFATVGFGCAPKPTPRSPHRTTHTLPTTEATSPELEAAPAPAPEATTTPPTAGDQAEPETPPNTDTSSGTHAPSTAHEPSDIEEPSGIEEPRSALCADHKNLPCDPVAWLSCYEPAQIEEKICSRCAELPGCDTEEKRIYSSWRARAPFEGFACEEYGWAISAIELVHGKTPSDPTWRAHARGVAWAKERREEQELVGIAARHVDLLKKQRSACQRERGASNKDRSIARGWFDALATRGRLPAGSISLRDGRRIQKAAFVKQSRELISSFAAHGEPLVIDRRTPISRIDEDDDWLSDSELPPYAYILSVRPSAAGYMSCVARHPEDCEGFETFYLFVNASGEIIAQSMIEVACPYVYVKDASGGRHKVGEILRELRGSSQRATQALRLPEVSRGQDVLEIELSEEKAETTYLDAVWLEGGGHTLRPRACDDSADAPTYCDEDSEDMILSEGETLRLEFDLPAGAHEHRWELVATGYYIPTAQ